MLNKSELYALALQAHTKKLEATKAEAEYKALAERLLQEMQEQGKEKLLYKSFSATLVGPGQPGTMVDSVKLKTLFPGVWAAVQKPKKGTAAYIKWM